MSAWESRSAPTAMDRLGKASTAATALARLTAAGDASKVSSETAESIAISVAFDVSTTSRLCARNK